VSDTRSGGIGFCGALFLLFLGLRLTEHIDWAWYWVAAPIWMPVVVVFAAAGLALVFVLPIEWIADNRRASKARAAWRAKNGVPKL
jgi:hypothetical protein